MEDEWVLMGECCQKCLKGVMKTMPEEILEHGTVVHREKCNACDKVLKYEIEPEQIVRDTGVRKCVKCDYEYCNIKFEIEWDFDSLPEIAKLFSSCPSCGANIFYQRHLREASGPFMHRHGNYGNHPITRKHRKVNKNDSNG